MKKRTRLTGHWRVECVDLPSGQVLWSERVENAATLAGCTHMLQSEFTGGSQVAAWYMGLISNDGYTDVDESDTMASHAGWVEATAHTVATRPQWTPLACVSGIIVNSSEVVMVATSVMSLRGLFITSNSTKGGTTGTLFSTAPFDTVRTVNAGNGIRLTYSVILTGVGQ